jgi:hypothetical protein
MGQRHCCPTLNTIVRDRPGAIVLNDISLFDGDTIIDRWVTDEDPETIASSNGYTIIGVEKMDVFVFVTMSV